MNTYCPFPLIKRLVSAAFPSRSAYRAAFAAMALGLFPAVASASTSYWSGATNANWDSASANWSSGGIPPATASAGSVIYFYTPPTNGNGTTTPVSLSVNYATGEINALVFTGTAATGSTGYTINASGSGSLGASVIQIAPSISVSGVTETVNAPITAGLGGQNGGNVYLENYAPLTANSAFPTAFGGTGYNDTLAIGGPLRIRPIPATRFL
jgi:hypothetical protein